MADTTYQPKVYRQQGGDRQVVASGGSLDVESGGEIDIESGGSLKLAGTAITSTAAELNIVDGLTATVAELNLIDGAIAGTAVASKALALGANKNVDTLAIADSGLKLGAGAGTAVTSTAAELNILDGVTATTAELNASSAAASLLADGLIRMGMARATYDFAEHGGAISAISLGVSLPDNAIVIGGFVDNITTLTSATDAATMALKVEGANDIVSAIAISDGSNPWDAGKKAIVPKSNTPESTGVKTTAARAITATIAVEAVTAGKFVVFLHYVVSD